MVLLEMFSQHDYEKGQPFYSSLGGRLLYWYQVSDEIHLGRD
jgi:hypothetical protein